MDIQQAYEDIAGHRLTQISDGNVKAFYLHGGDVMTTRMMSAMLVFTPENIIITGDLHPGRHGVISAAGYGLEWFCRNLEPDYLASKFLESGVWEEDRARDELQRYIHEHTGEAWCQRDKRTVKRLRGLRNMLRTSPWIYESAQTWYDAVSEHISDLWDHGQFWGYPTTDYIWLAAIQRRFREAYQLFVAETAGEDAAGDQQPSWASAPGWASYLAQDFSGAWGWYEEIPVPFESGGFWQVRNGSRFQYASPENLWMDSLVENPKYKREPETAVEEAS
jgi:hypothetical protein